jgi:prepilin-type N-terminal cleavage/methylation domain-containing protein
VAGRSRRPARERRRGEDSGFTLIELLVALLILAIVLVSVAYTLTSSFSSVAYATQSQVADSLANKAIEEIRGLPLATLAQGLDDTDTTIATDPYISSSGSTPPTYTFTLNGETIVHSKWSSSSPVPPLTPSHNTSPPPINGTTYKVAVYPTLYQGHASEYRVTVIVTWTPNDRPGTNAQVTDQTIVYSPSGGCLSTTTHPYSAPCQPYFQSDASLGNGYIEIVAPPGYTGSLISGASFTNASLYLPQSDSNVDSEQVSTAVGNAGTTGATVTSSGSTSSTGEIVGTASADSDPGSATAPAASGMVNQSAASAGVTSGGSNANTLTLTPSSNDGGSYMATAATMVAATSGGVVPACNDLSGASQNTKEPCASSSIDQPSTASIQLSLYAASEGLGNAPIATIAPWSSTTASTGATFAAQYDTAGTGYCTSTTTGTDGCVHAGAQRQIGTVDVGGLPPQLISDGFAPAGWSSANDLFELDNYSASVASESGIGTLSCSSPCTSPSSYHSYSVPISGQSATPTLSYYDPTSHSYKSVTDLTSGSTITIPSFTVTDPNVQSHAATVTESATLTIGAASVSATGSGPCSSSSPCSETETLTSPVSGDVFYEVQWNNGTSTTTLAEFDIHIDLGTIKATTTYQESPSAG